MSEHHEPPTFGQALAKTAVQGIPLWGVIWVGTAILIAIDDVGGGGHNGYGLDQHWSQFWCPATKLWFLCFLLHNWWEMGSKKWIVATVYTYVMPVFICFYLLADVKHGAHGGHFLFRTLPAEFGVSGPVEWLFPDPVPPNRKK